MNTNKLTLKELEVESFATQISEKEMINLKGGTTWACVGGVLARKIAEMAVSGAVGYYTSKAIESTEQKPDPSPTPPSDDRDWIGITADSVRIYDDGSKTFYHIKIDSIR